MAEAPFAGPFAPAGTVEAAREKLAAELARYERTQNGAWAWMAYNTWYGELRGIDPLPDAVAEYLRLCFWAIVEGTIGLLPDPNDPDDTAAADTPAEILGGMQLLDHTGGGHGGVRLWNEVEAQARLEDWDRICDAMRRREAGAPKNKTAAREHAAQRWSMTAGSVKQFLLKHGRK